MMDQRLALGACTPQIAHPIPPPPPPKGASGQQLVGGVIGVQNRELPPPP